MAAVEKQLYNFTLKMEEVISKVSAGIEKAKADIISVIDENQYGQPIQSSRLESGANQPH